MFRVFLFVLVLLCSWSLQVQDYFDLFWYIFVMDIDFNNYYGIIVVNGVVGIVFLLEFMKIQDVVLNGVYDYYQCGCVFNIFKIFNYMNLDLDVDGCWILWRDISDFQ